MSSNKLKVIALIAMIFDHINNFFPSTPLYFRWIGRLSAPLFIFCVVWSFTYTKSKKHYIFRLYIASVVMSFINWGFSVDNNIFRLLFSLSIVLYLIESCRNKEKNAKRNILIYIVWQVIICTIIILIENFMPFNLMILRDINYFIIPSVFGSIIYLEFGYIFVFLGVVIYLCKNNKKDLITYYSYFCLFYLWITTSTFIVYFYKLPFSTYLIEKIMGFSTRYIGESMFRVNYQWMMLFALPFMLAYNHKKGRNWKYFYYIIYPAHIILFVTLGKIVS